ncbi:dipeptidylpeptidase, partial [Coemansia erecta]
MARPFTPEDLVQTNRLGATAVSPGNTAVAYIQSQYSIDSKRQTTKLIVQSLNDNNYSIEVVIHSADARVNPPKDSASKNSEDYAGSDSLKWELKPSQPVWLSDSVLGFVAPDKSSSGSTLYSVSQHKGFWSKPHPLASIPVPISSVQFNPKSGILAFIASVYNGTSTLEETADIDRHEQERADTAQVHEDLWVRFWDTYISPKLPQIHTLKLVSASNNSLEPKGKPRNIIKDTKADGRMEALDSFVLSPNGLQIAFVAKKPSKEYAWKTTSYVYLADVDGSAAVPINPGNGGASSSPSFNHDGTKVAYIQIASSSNWAGRGQIKIYDISAKTMLNIAADWDRSPAQVEWADASTLLVMYTECGRIKLAKIDIATGVVTPIVSKHTVDSFKVLSGTNKLLVSYSAFDSPSNLYTISTDGSNLERITDTNPALGKEVALSVPEDVEFVGADNATIHGFLLRPPQFDESKKYPLAFIIHGGPQSSFSDAWSLQWNQNIFSSAGFVTVALNPQGSTGYGQEFIDAIRNQWGGKPYDSLMMSLEQLLEAHPYIDRNRMAALGASY